MHWQFSGASCQREKRKLPPARSLRNQFKEFVTHHSHTGVRETAIFACDFAAWGASGRVSKARHIDRRGCKA
jgi:hypothetical protein